MAHVVESHFTTPYADLRRLLDNAERQLPTLAAASLADYLLLLDQIEATLAQLTTAADDTDPLLRTEQVRWADLQEKILLRSQQFVQLANKSGGFSALRRRSPASHAFWWQLDRQVADQRRRSLRRWLRWLAAAAVLALAVTWSYRTWLAPDPATLALLDTLNTIERQVDAQEWLAARTTAATALTDHSTDVETLLWAAVLAEQAKDNAAALRYQQQARAQLGDREPQFYLLLGNKRLRAGNLDGAAEAAEQALRRQPQEPQVFFLLGNLAEARGDLNAALDAFDQAARLAETDNPQLTVISKMRYGFLLQQLQMQMPPPPPAEPAPTATPPAR